MSASAAEGHSVYRVVSIRPWASEGTQVPESVQTFFGDKQGDVDDLRALAVSFGGEIQSLVNNPERRQAVLFWNGHHFDLDLDLI